MPNVRYLPAAIEKKKQKLRRIEEEEGLSENFGQGEVLDLESKYDMYQKLSDGRQACDLIRRFRDWCSTYKFDERKI